MKIALIGGHLTPALALIDYIKIHHQDDQLIFFGRLYARQSSNQPAHEQDEVLKRQVQFIPFNSGKLNNQSIIGLVKNIWLLCLGIPYAFYLLIKHKPTVVISFGSYLAVPLIIAAWVLKIPSLTHEQTQTTGLANKLIGQLVQIVAISYQNSSIHFPKQRTVITGPLLRPQVLQTQNTIPSWVNQKNDKPVIYITGGSQGSEIINCTIAQILQQLTKKWFVVHQCGSKSDKRNYAQELAIMAKRLPKLQQRQYVVLEWLSEHELAWVFSNAQIVISRAGANTVTEIQYNAIPSILIPLPFAYKQEQQKNAASLVNFGGAIILEQKILNTKTLLDTLDQVTPKLPEMKKALLKNRPKNGVKSLYNLIHDIAAS